MKPRNSVSTQGTFHDMAHFQTYISGTKVVTCAASILLRNTRIKIGLTLSRDTRKNNLKSYQSFPSQKIYFEMF